jgi:hypothetical protein
VVPGEREREREGGGRDRPYGRPGNQQMEKPCCVHIQISSMKVCFNDN